jgi:hypothetical protein
VHRKKLGDGGPLLVCELTRFLVADLPASSIEVLSGDRKLLGERLRNDHKTHPAVNAAASRIHPQQMPETKVLAQDAVNDFDGYLQAPWRANGQRQLQFSQHSLHVLS